MRLLPICCLAFICNGFAEPENHLDVSLIGVSDDSFTFGQYNGLYEQGAHLDAGFHWSPVNANWTLSGKHLGLDNRELQFHFPDPGRLNITVSYNEIYRRSNDSGVTPFSGSSTQSLPVVWTPAVRATGFNPALITSDVDPATRRRILTADIDVRLSETFGLGSTVKFTERQGDRLTAGAVYSDAANPLGVALIAPIDESVTEAELRAQFEFGKLSLQIAPRFIWFKNQEEGLAWQNPYATGSDSRIDYPAGFGSLSTAPDYEHRGLSVTGTYRWQPKFLLVLTSAESVTEQEDDLSDYTINPLLNVSSQLPVSALDGELQTRRWTLGLRTRPFARTTVNVTYLFRERDNTASSYAWLRVPGDGADQLDSRFALTNRSLKQNIDRFTVEGAYRLRNRTRLTLGYENEQQYRNHAAVTDTELETWSFSANSPITPTFSAAMTASYANKAGSTYEWSRSFFQTLSSELIEVIPDDQRWLNHPLLRQYHLANHEDVTIEWRANWSINPEWQAQVSATFRDVDFDRSELGLTGSRRHQLHFSLNHEFAQARGTAWFWADASRQDRDQRGRDFGGGIQKPANRVSPPLPQASDPARDYETRLRTDMLSVGLGFNWNLADSMTLELQYVGMDVDESYDLSTSGARDLASENLPTNHYRLHDLRSTVRYQSSERTELALTWRYYRFAEDNFQLNNLSPMTIERFLWTGQQAANEAVNLIALSMHYRFGSQ